jgi:MFS family permease
MREILGNRRNLVLLLGTAGTWFLFDYAYYGNTVSTPQILKLVSPHFSLTGAIAMQLAIFVVAALPGYLLAIAKVDKIGHRRLQWTGFVMMAAALAAIGLVPGVSTAVVPFVLAYGLSYFFSEFGPNTTTFVLSSELFPVSMRATGHGISAGFAKIGAFLGAFAFPLLQPALGLRGTLTLTACLSLLGALLTLVLPEPSGRSLEEINGEEEVVAEAERVIAVADVVVEAEQAARLGIEPAGW